MPLGKTPVAVQPTYCLILTKAKCLLQINSTIADIHLQISTDCRKIGAKVDLEPVRTRAIAFFCLGRARHSKSCYQHNTEQQKQTC